MPAGNGLNEDCGEFWGPMNDLKCGAARSCCGVVGKRASPPNAAANA